MTLFEVTLLLLAMAVVLMQAARYLRVPYPALLALVGGCATVLPFAPHLTIEPRLALALFVAPAVMDTAFELPPRELMRNWVPLVSLAVLLVLAGVFAPFQVPGWQAFSERFVPLGVTLAVVVCPLERLRGRMRSFVPAALFVPTPSIDGRKSGVGFAPGLRAKFWLGFGNCATAIAF